MKGRSSISAWQDPWTEEPGGATVHWVAKALDTTQQLNDSNNEYYKICSCLSEWSPSLKT